LEDSNQLFLSCPFSSKVWYTVLCWLGLSFTLPKHISQLYLQMGECLNGIKNKVLKYIFWHATCWCIWIQRNRIIFKEQNAEFSRIIAHIKAISWQWLLYKRGVKPGLFYSPWHSNPMGCLLWLNFLDISYTLGRHFFVGSNGLARTIFFCLLWSWIYIWYICLNKMKDMQKLIKKRLTKNIFKFFNKIELIREKIDRILLLAFLMVENVLK